MNRLMWIGLAVVGALFVFSLTAPDGDPDAQANAAPECQLPDGLGLEAFQQALDDCQRALAGDQNGQMYVWEWTHVDGAYGAVGPALPLAVVEDQGVEVLSEGSTVSVTIEGSRDGEVFFTETVSHGNLAFLTVAFYDLNGSETFTIKENGNLVGEFTHE